jgi:heme-degrading monooxygenase HmoA
MHARVSRYQGGTEQLLEGFRRTTEALEAQDGFARAYFLADPGGDRAMTITIWESEDALVASSAWADKAREHAAHESNTTIESVETYEVALTTERTPLR